MYKLIIFLLTIIQLTLNVKISPAPASVEYFMQVTTRGQHTVPVRQRPNRNSIIIHRLSNQQGVAICSQCDREISFRDSGGNMVL